MRFSIKATEEGKKHFKAANYEHGYKPSLHKGIEQHYEYFFETDEYADYKKFLAKHNVEDNLAKFIHQGHDQYDDLNGDKEGIISRFNQIKNIKVNKI